MRLIDCSTPKFPNVFSKVDDNDFENLRGLKWYVQLYGKKLYVHRHKRIGINKETVVMIHRVIMSAKKGEIVDHIDGDPLNNTRSNLRICTQAQNMWNIGSQGGTSKYKGVTLHKDTGKWQALIVANRRSKYLGLFTTQELAAKAYNEAAQSLHGEFARLNEIKESP